MLPSLERGSTLTSVVSSTEPPHTMTFFPTKHISQLHWNLHHRFPVPHTDNLTHVRLFEYLGIPLDERLTMAPLKTEILDKIKKK